MERKRKTDTNETNGGKGGKRRRREQEDDEKAGRTRIMRVEVKGEKDEEAK